MGVLLAMLVPLSAWADDAPVATPVSFTGADGTTLHGELIAPRGAAHRPALVMVGGAGPVTTAELRPGAEAYARHGIPTLIYDKRTDGYSTTHRDFGQLAEDALAAVRLLRTRPEADPGRVGLWGLSEGAWAVSLAAGRSDDVAYVITAGAVGLTPARQQAWAYGEFLRHAGVSGSLTEAMQVTAIRQLAGAGLFAEADYDPVPAWRRVRQPVLAEWGALDREAAPAESERIVRQALEDGGNRHFTIRTVPGVRHNLQRTFDDGFDRPTALPADYADHEAAWIGQLADGLPPVSVDAPPAQGVESHALAPLGWYERPWLQACLSLFCLAGFGGYLLGGALRRLRRHPRPADLPRLACWAASAGAFAVLGSMTYLLFMVLTAGSLPGPVLLGRPVVWLLLQLASVAALVCTGLAVLRGHRARRVLLLAASGAAFVPWALYWGLLKP
ncbi:alpha/beta hydrolase family protein [Kitasatospora sp. NPDC101183]|uniref:alpha/beta hydrolase family protein n=1 Tax=Kitasatospora sp. NPDC101183 TaxID=3364100 RepID=UPI00380D7FDF